MNIEGEKEADISGSMGDNAHSQFWRVRSPVIRDLEQITQEAVEHLNSREDTPPGMRREMSMMMGPTMVAYREAFVPIDDTSIIRTGRTQSESQSRLSEIIAIRTGVSNTVTNPVTPRRATTPTQHHYLPESHRDTLEINNDHLLDSLANADIPTTYAVEGEQHRLSQFIRHPTESERKLDAELWPEHIAVYGTLDIPAR